MKKTVKKAKKKSGTLLQGVAPILQEAPRVNSGRMKGVTFEAQGERLGSLRVEKGGRKIKATIYRSATLERPGFVLLSKGVVKQQGLWFDCLEDESSARFCQVVVEGDVEWGSRLPSEFRATFRKLAKLAAQKSQDLETASPQENQQAAPPDHSSKLSSDMVDLLLETPRFLAAYQNQKDGRPPVVTLAQILKLLCHGGGQLPLQTVKERIGLPDHRLTEILHQMDSILRAGEEVALSLSIDGSLLLLDQERLRRLFALQVSKLDDEKVVRSETVDGGSRELCLPLEINLKERRVLEALLRYGRMSEGELAQILGSRRVGGLLEKLLSRLEDVGFYGLAIVGEGDQGRIFQIAN